MPFQDFVTDHKLCLWCILSFCAFILFTNWKFQIALPHVCCWFCLPSSVWWQKDPIPFDAAAVCIIWSTQQSFLVSYLYWLFFIYLTLWLNCVYLKKFLKVTFETRQTVFGSLCDRKDPELLKHFFLYISCTIIIMLAVVSVTILYNLRISGLHRRQNIILWPPASFAFLVPLR